MLEPKTGNRLRNKIWDDKTHKDVSYYADFFSNADYGTTHVAVLSRWWRSFRDIYYQHEVSLELINIGRTA